MTPTLDRNRDYGTVHGDHEHGAAFTQDGFLFDARYEIIEGAMDEEAHGRFLKMQQEREAVEKAKEAFRSFMPDADEATISKIINADNLRAPSPADDVIDLEAWANGSKTYLFGRVTKLIREKFNISPANKRQALEILAENGIGSVSGTISQPSL
jgi:hypothetical protein